MGVQLAAVGAEQDGRRYVRARVAADLAGSAAGRIEWVLMDREQAVRHYEDALVVFGGWLAL